MHVTTGLENLLKHKDSKYKRLKNLRIGMITNHTSVTKELKLGVEELLHSSFQITKIFGPEHGFRGSISAGEKVSDEMDARTGIQVFSLYGDTKKPTAEMLAGLDAILFDIQDLGVRFYTYINTMAYAMEAACEHGLEFYVLDRPNPITGSIVEGNILDDSFRSFVGRYPIPLRHGLTIGELALLLNEEFSIGCSLTIIPMDGWRRGSWFDETDLPWVMPSTNATGMEMALLYPGTCLFEGTNVSEGRGTTKPFEIIGAPWIDGYEWAAFLNQLGLSGVIFRPTYFKPLTSKYQGELCQGIQIHITDRGKLQSVKLGGMMVESLKSLYPTHFMWIKSVKDTFFIDLLMGTDQFRHYINEGKVITNWLDKEQKACNLFSNKSVKYHLYQ